jgi:hypothetical protein
MSALRRMSAKHDDDDAVFRVETIPPPSGPSDAYSAPTKVGPMTPALVEEMMLAAKAKADAKRISAEATARAPRFVVPASAVAPPPMPPRVVPVEPVFPAPIASPAPPAQPSSDLAARLVDPDLFSSEVLIKRLETPLTPAPPRPLDVTFPWPPQPTAFLAPTSRARRFSLLRFVLVAAAIVLVCGFAFSVAVVRGWIAR